jgi:carboxyl-terminal processing protease
MLPDNVMWVRIAAFNEGTAADLERVLRRGDRLGAEGVILDLRSNPGGLIVEEMAVADQLLPEGSVIFQEQFANGDVDVISTTENNGEWQEQPLVVLINAESVSAAEVTAAALAENDRAITIGQTTFGTGTTIMPMNLEDGSMVRIGVSMWLTPDGNVIWHKGLEPMIEVDNEPHVPISLPYSYDDNEISSEEMVAIEDDQLLTGYEQVVDVIADAGD